MLYEYHRMHIGRCLNNNEHLEKVVNKNVITITLTTTSDRFTLDEKQTNRSGAFFGPNL